MTDLEVNRAVEQVERNQVELHSAIGNLEDSLKETSQKVSQALEAMKKYPGLIWAVAGAIGATAAIDFFTNYVRKGKSDSKISNFRRSAQLIEGGVATCVSMRDPD